MAKRALLIGSQTGGLRGVHGDVRVMSEALAPLGFTVIVVTEAKASHSGVVDAYRGLIQDSAAGDVAVVYYSGHGGRVVNALRTRDPQLPAFLHYLVPTDIDDRSGGVFRGLLAEELSQLQWELTAKTTNVTTILDCCHSARMSRDPGALPKASNLAAFPWESVAERWTALRDGSQMGGFDANPHAVQLVACSPDQSAFELAETPLGGPHGALTNALVPILASGRVGGLTWRDVLDVVRPAILDVVPAQRPELTGPNADRFVFSAERRDAVGVRPVVLRDGAAWIEGASLFGLAEEDRWALVAPGGDPRRPLAEAVVDLVGGDRARLALTGAEIADLPAGSSAYPIDVALGRRPVAVVPPAHPDRPAIVEAINRSAYVRMPDETEAAGAAGGAGEVVATVSLDAGGILLLDAERAPLRAAPRPITTDTVAGLLDDLRTLARATHLRELDSGTGDLALPEGVTVTFAKATAAGPLPIEGSGAHLFVGERLAVEVQNTTAERRYATLLNIDQVGAVTLMTPAEPDGTTLDPGRSVTLGEDPLHAVGGFELYWPEGLPETGPRPETYLVVVADRKVDGLSALAQPGVKARGGAANRSYLDKLLDDVNVGRRAGRVTPVAEAEVPVRYRVHRLDLLLHPTPPPTEGGADATDEPAFAIDTRPDLSFRLVVPRSATAPPARVAVRLKELTVHRNRALFSTGVRLDAMVLTAPSAGSGEPYHAHTERFARIGDGDRLPFDDLLVYEGPAGRFLDLAVWVAREEQRELDLAELLSDETNRDDVKGAIVLLAGLAVAAPAAAAVAGSVAAVATLVRTGARLLDKAVGRSIGVYRTSLLPHERFGAGQPAGRHPASGSLTAQDVSFAFEVVDLDE